jgi:hypothetical protein
VGYVLPHRVHAAGRLSPSGVCCRKPIARTDNVIANHGLPVGVATLYEAIKCGLLSASAETIAQPLSIAALNIDFNTGSFSTSSAALNVSIFCHSLPLVDRGRSLAFRT